MQRIAIVGSTGSGKTTLAKELATRLNLPHIEMDALNWEANWVNAPQAIFRERLHHALQAPQWVVDGNYSTVRDLVWRQADTLIWLDYPFPLVLARLTRRTLRRIVTRQALWQGNRETFRQAFLSSNSLYLWLWKTHWKRRRTYADLLKHPDYDHLTVLHFRHPRDTARWLKQTHTQQP